MDFVPSLAFLVGSYFLARFVRLQRNPFSFVVVVAGSSLVFLGGAFQALWKLLYTLGVADIRLMSNLQFVLLAPGFLTMLLGVIAVARRERRAWKTALLGIAPWKIPLLATMTLCSLGVQGILTHLAFRRRARLAAAMYILAVLCMFGMAGMAGGEQSIARQWVEESINSLGQIAYALGSYLLYLNAVQTTVKFV